MTTNSNVERIYRLGPLQDGMFFEALRKQGSSEVIYQACLDLTGEVRPALLRQAWRTVSRRHPVLRTSYHYERLDEPVQVVRADADPPWREEDWRHDRPEDHDRRLDELIVADRETPFELTRAPLMRFTLVRLTGERSCLVWTYHHLLLDGWSMYMVLDEVMSCYRELRAGRVPDLPPVRPYWEYVAWVRRRDAAGAAAFWKQRLAGFTTPVPLGRQETVIPPTGEEFDEVSLDLPRDTEIELGGLVRKHHVTPGTVVQAAWAVALSRYAGRDDVVFGSIVSGRTPEFTGIDDMVGLFINVLPVRTRVAGDLPVARWLTRLQGELAEARQYEYANLAQVQRWSEVPKGAALFESLVAFINYPVRKSWTDGGTFGVTGQRVLQKPHYPLHLTVVTGAEGWRLTLGYDTRRFSRLTVSRIVDLVADALAAMAADPRQSLDELPRWLPAPLALLAADPSASPVMWGDLVRAAAGRRPDATAVVAGEERISYRELIERAERLAARLKEAGGVPGAAVELRMPRTVSWIVALVAVGLEAMAAAVHPSGSDLLCQDDPRAPDAIDVTSRTGPAPVTTAALPVARNGDPITAPAFPTSRSGDLMTAPALLMPDAVVSHRELAGLVVWFQREMGLDERDRVLIDGTDEAVRVRDTLWALAAGSTVVMPQPGQESSAQDITVAMVSPEVAGWAGPGGPSSAPSLRRLAVSPGPVPAGVLDGLRHPSGAELVEEFPTGTPGLAGTFSAAGRLITSPSCGRRRDSPRSYLSPSAGPATWAVAASLSVHPGVQDVAVVTDDQAASTAFVEAPGGAVSAAELAELVAARLGRAAVPGRFVVLDALPVTPDGLVDLAALSSPEEQAQQAPGLDDPVAEVLTEIWARVLNLTPDRLAGGDDFFDLGGHSLAAIKLVSRVRSKLDVDFTLNDLFADPTVPGSARTVRALMGDGPGGGSDAAIPRTPRGTPLPMSFGQERLWFLDRIGAAPPNNVLLPSRIGQRIDAAVLGEALKLVVRRHEVLHTRLVELDGRPAQVIDDGAAPRLAVDDLAHLDEAEAHERARALLEADVHRRFDLAAEAPLRARLIRLAPDDHVLGLCVHHVAFDGWSTSVLFQDLDTAYGALLRGRADPLPELPVQYADYAAYQREQLSGERLERLLEHWRDRLAGAPEVLELDGGRPGPRSGTPSGAAYECHLPGTAVSGLRELAGEEAATLFMALVTAYAVLLARHSGRDDVIIGFPMAGRQHPDLTGMIGFFVNTLVLRIDLAGAETYRELLREARRASLDALVHGEVPFEKLVQALRPERARDRLPLVQVSFNFQSTLFAPLEFDGRPVDHFPVDQEVPRFDLEVEAYPWGDGVKCVFHYAADRFSASYMAGLAEEYLDIVRQMADRPDDPVTVRASADRPADLGALSEASRDALRTALAATDEGTTS